MKKKILAIPTGLFLTGALWPVVSAAGDADKFAKLDRNQDGFVSLAEAGADVRLADQFANLDTDGDGQLSKAELSGGKDSSAEKNQ